LLENKMFDYVDIDPFGSPVPFLDAAVRSLKTEGILAVTATDTAALCGTSVKACRRKYWSEPLRTAIMKEVAVRILIRRVQLIAASYETCFEPVLSYAHEHYMRVFLRRTKGGSGRVDDMLKKHSSTSWSRELQAVSHKSEAGTEFGPLWVGPIQNKEF